MNTLDDGEQEALDFAGECAGAYLDEINKTDLATLTKDEWDIFVQVMCLRYMDKRVESIIQQPQPSG